MSNYLWLGYTEDALEAYQLIKETGHFYLLLCFSFLFYFLFLYKKSATIREIKKTHLVFIMLWGLAGILLIKMKFVIFCTFIIATFAARNIFLSLWMSGIFASIIVPLPTLNPTKKSHRFFQELQKRNFTPSVFVSCSQINEFILWAFIFYRSTITSVAALTLYLH